MSAVMGNGKHLHFIIDCPVDDRKRETRQANLTKIWLPSKFEPMGRCDCLADGLHCRGVVLPAKSNAALLVVADLLFMLQSRFWMEAIGHLKRA